MHMTNLHSVFHVYEQKTVHCVKSELMIKKKLS